MNIQNIVFPQIGICDKEEMFFRRCINNNISVSFDKTARKLDFVKFGKVNFNTYFNCFSICKWKKYTKINNLSLILMIEGDFHINVYDCLANGKWISEKKVDEYDISSKGKEEVKINLNIEHMDGIITFSLTALSAHAVLYGGFYSTDIDKNETNETNIAINICTFKREKFILHNIDVLKKYIIENVESPLYNHLQVYISDNGKSLPLSEINSDTIHIVENKNVGGAGGFSRGIIEILNNMDSFCATHALMMDDDIVIMPESLFRTYTILSCRKEEYIDLFIGGAMLKIDQPTIQVESGASWNAGELISNKFNYDMQDFVYCVQNEVEEYTEYNAWWYCCTPISVINENNLPLPIFIRGDDLEYGLRNMKDLFLLNGICVWHESFENKYSSFLQYYILRNLLYDNSLHCRNYTRFNFLIKLLKNVAREMIYYRYKNIDLILRGVEDFFKGTEFLINTDAEKLHKEIMAAGYRAESMNLDITHYDDNKITSEGKISKLIRAITINGYLLPAKSNKEIIVSMAQCKPIDFYRFSNVLNYDPVSGKGFITSKSYKEAFRTGIQCLKIVIKILFCYGSAVNRFRKDYHSVTNMKFWKKYLDI